MTSIVSAVVVLGLLIFVHELGHFLAARRRGVKVSRFSIGFGPAIWSHQAKDGVEYRLSWIPLGGYVALPQLADMAATIYAMESVTYLTAGLADRGDAAIARRDLVGERGDERPGDGRRRARDQAGG